MIRIVKDRNGDELLAIENARIFFKNFSGRPGKYNREGVRNFNVEIDDEEFAQQMIRDGWNIRVRPPREEGDPVRYRVEVTVNFEHHPPRIFLVTRKNRVELTEETVGQLDTADIDYIDMVIKPRPWVVQEGTPYEKSGIKAYLRSMYVTLAEDVFAEKYSID